MRSRARTSRPSSRSSSPSRHKRKARHARRAFFMRECYVCTRRREMEDADACAQIACGEIPSHGDNRSAIARPPRTAGPLDRRSGRRGQPRRGRSSPCRAGLDNAGVSSKAEKPSHSAEQAAGMAGDMIDYLGDRSATREDREQRKRRLVKGPPEFREMRKQHGDARRKK